MKSRNKMIACAAILAIVCAGGAFAQDNPSGGKWTVDLTPYLWAAGVDSEIEIGPLKGETDSDFSDILDSLEGAIMLHLEVGRERYGFFSDLMYMKLNVDADRRLLDLELDLELLMLEAGGYYRFGSPKRSLDLLAGARLIAIDTELELTPGPDASKNVDWVDPIVGARLIGSLSEKWSYSLRGDVGGFGVGSDITWNAIALLRYDLTKRSELVFGYRYLYIDYDSGRFELRTSFHGPIMGVNIRF